MSKSKNLKRAWSADASADEVLQDMREAMRVVRTVPLYPAIPKFEVRSLSTMPAYAPSLSALGAGVVQGPAARISPFAQAGIAPEKTGGGGCPYAPEKKVVDKQQ